jgi:hypothetical protein
MIHGLLSSPRKNAVRAGGYVQRRRADQKRNITGRQVHGWPSADQLHHPSRHLRFCGQDEPPSKSPCLCINISGPQADLLQILTCMKSSIHKTGEVVRVENERCELLPTTPSRSNQLPTLLLPCKKLWSLVSKLF